MQRYAAWKAADIRKAVREGRAPTPGPPGGEGAGDASADLPSPPGATDLPTPPGGGKPAILPRSESDVGGASTPPPPTRHAPGGAVLYCHDGHVAAVAGTIAKVNPSEGLGVTYVVALADQVVSAFEAQLAPSLEVGAAVRAAAAGDAASPAPGDYVVTAVDTTIWRPRYTLTPAAGGGAPVTVDDSVLKSWPSPRGRAPKAPKDAPFAAAHAPATSEPSAPPPPPPPVVAVPAASAPVAPAPAAGQPSLKDMQDAIKAAKSAISSLQFEDVKTAVKYLTAALDLCTKK